MSVLVVALAVGVLLVSYSLTSRPPTSAPAPTTPASSSPASRPPASPTPTGPRVILEENFDSGRLDSSVWNTCHWWDDEGCAIASNEPLAWYRPEQVRVSDGVLQLIAEPGKITGSDGETYDFRSGMVTTGPPSDDEPAKVAFTYGSVEARLRIPAGRGLWPAMWLLPANTQSRPEIDILEAIGQDPGTQIMHLHPRDRSAESPSKRYKLPRSTLADGWHTLRLDWTPGRLRFFTDGVQTWQITGAQVPDEPMYLVLNLAVGGVYPGDPDRTTKFPATFAIDHVRIAAAA